MAQITHVGQGLGHAMGPLVASTMLLISLVFALLGIKIWGFKRRLNFGRPETSSPASQAAASANNVTTSRNARGLQVNGTDNAVHGVFRQRNADDLEGARLSTAAAKYVTGSVPDLRLHKLEVGPAQSLLASPTPTAVALRQPPQAPRRRRRDVHSSSFEYFEMPATRAAAPCVPVPVPAPAPEPETSIDLNIPNFEHFAQKFELLAVNSFAADQRLLQVANKHGGGYIKYEQVDDDLVDLTVEQEMMTPAVDDQQGAALSVSALVHHEPDSPAPAHSTQTAEHGYADTAFVVEIISDMPNEPPFDAELFSNLEMLSDDAINTLSSETDVEFLRNRSCCELNEADILDLDNLQMPAAASPPGFGKSIEEDWENFENLDVVEVPEVDWSIQPDAVEQVATAEVTMSEATLTLDNVVHADNLFQQLEVVEHESPNPPAYDAHAMPVLPDYDSLMRLEHMQKQHILPKYTDVVPKYVNSIEDLYAELPTNGTGTELDDSNADEFENLCQELEIVEAAPPARLPPQPAPRCSKQGTLNVRGEHAMPLPCYQPEELPSLTDTEAELELKAVEPAPQPAKRKQRHALHVRFDVDNLQYYQSAELPNSSESEMESEQLEKPQPMQRLSSTSDEAHVPMLFGRQVSNNDSSDEDGWQAIRQHRSMTEQLQQQLPAGSPAAGDTEA